jgi:hypothetical protein
LDEDDAADHADSSSSVPNVFDFRSLFEKYTGLYKNKKENIVKPAEPETETVGPEGGVFKSNLGKLMNITREYEKRGSENGDEFTNEK